MQRDSWEQGVGNPLIRADLHLSIPGLERQ
jgi:hypothetical protein